MVFPQLPVFAKGEKAGLLGESQILRNQRADLQGGSIGTFFINPCFHFLMKIMIGRGHCSSRRHFLLKYHLFVSLHFVYIMERIAQATLCPSLLCCCSICLWQTRKKKPHKISVRSWRMANSDPQLLFSHTYLGFLAHLLTQRPEGFLLIMGYFYISLPSGLAFGRCKQTNKRLLKANFQQ